MQQVARANLIFGLHIHVGVNDREVAIHIMNAARYFLPHIFALSTNSDYAHIIALFRNFENTLPLFTIENIGLRSGGEGSADLSLSFGISSYYQSLPTTLGDKTTPVADLAVSQKELLTALEGYSNYPLVPDTSGVGKTNPFK